METENIALTFMKTNNYLFDLTKLKNEKRKIDVSKAFCHIISCIPGTGIRFMSLSLKTLFQN